MLFSKIIVVNGINKFQFLTRYRYYCAWFLLSVSSLLLSVMVSSCHAWVNLIRLRSLGFTPTLRSGRSPSLTRDSGLAVQKLPQDLTFGLHEIFKCAHLKFTVYGRKQTDIHTTSANAVTLVWGSLRLAPINWLLDGNADRKWGKSPSIRTVNDWWPPKLTIC